MKLVPFTAPHKGLHRFTYGMQLDEVMAYVPGRWNFTPIVLRRKKPKITYYYVLREIAPGENLRTFKINPDSDTLFTLKED